MYGWTHVCNVNIRINLFTYLKMQTFSFSVGGWCAIPSILSWQLVPPSAIQFPPRFGRDRPKRHTSPCCHCLLNLTSALATNVTNPSFLNPFEFGNQTHLCHGFQKEVYYRPHRIFAFAWHIHMVNISTLSLLSKVWLTRFDESNAV